jgi:integrase
MALSDMAIRSAKARPQAFKLSDERGLYLLVGVNGSKLWRFKYRMAGKEKLLSFGAYPDVGLKLARERRDDARRLLAKNIDPSAHRKLQKRQDVATAESFKTVALEWLAKFSPGWASSHADKIVRRFEKDIYPWIGVRPIADITAQELLAVLRRIETRGAIETAHRAKQECGNVFRYAIATGRAERDPSQDLRGALPPSRGKHFAAITEPKAIGELLCALDSYSGSPVTIGALKLAPLVFVRPGELRQAEWAEIDWDTEEWRIPAAKTKKRVMHIVPLAYQAIDALTELHPLIGGGKYVFPGEYHRDRPMSENTILSALRRLGYKKEQMTGHGFRHMASTLLNEQGWNRDAIERQLAHADRDPIRAAYNYAEHLAERKKMMQAWANYLDRLRQEGKFHRIIRKSESIGQILVGGPE